MASIIQHAGRLFNIALEAANGIKVGEHDRHQQAALVSLVFAVVSLEAFLNESVELAEVCPISGGQWGIMLVSAQNFFLLGLREAQAKPPRRTHG